MPTDLGRQALGLDLLRYLAQRDLAQRGEVLDAEEAVEGGVDALGLVDLAGPQAGEQGLRAEIDEHDLVGAAENRVGNGLADADAAQLGHLVVERLEVLHVDRREDVDARVEQVLDVLVALAVLEPRRVGMGQLVDQGELGLAAQDGRKVHVAEVGAPVGDAPLRHHRQPLGQRLRLLAPVGLEQPDDHVAPGLLLGVTLEQHAVGLADPRGHAQVDRVVAAPRARAFSDGLTALLICRHHGRPGPVALATPRHVARRVGRRVERPASVDEQFARKAHAVGVDRARRAEALGEVEQGASRLAGGGLVAHRDGGAERRVAPLGASDGVLELPGQAPARVLRRHPGLAHRTQPRAQPETQDARRVDVSCLCVCHRHAPSRLWTIRSMSLIPMNGAMRPPRP